MTKHHLFSVLLASEDLDFISSSLRIRKHPFVDTRMDIKPKVLLSLRSSA